MSGELIIEACADDEPMRELAARLGVPLVEPGRGAPGEALRVARVDGRLEVREPGDRPGRGVRIELDPVALRPGAGGLSGRQPLARAIGRPPRRILDATAGLGQDAALLAAAGHHVTAVERSPVLALMLREAVEHASGDAVLDALLGARLVVVEGDAREILPSLSPPPEVVYVDPMYPPKRKRSALPPKPIRIVRRLVGADDDLHELLAAARRVATSRVVVKRPRWAPPLADDAVASHPGKLARYDVYRPAGG